MLNVAIVLFVLCLISAILGFGGFAQVGGTVAMVGMVMYFVFLVAFVVALFAGGMRRQRVR
jgi:uncharacterized membrane protein YtjA (UPF0391 family)